MKKLEKSKKSLTSRKKNDRIKSERKQNTRKGEKNEKTGLRRRE